MDGCGTRLQNSQQFGKQAAYAAKFILRVFGKRRDQNSVRHIYRSDQEWIGIVEQLKQTRCPHCHAHGTLNRHGVLYGFDDTNDGNPQRTLRAPRIFCSKRRQSRPGCGRTFSKHLDVDALAYLRDVLERLPNHPADRLEELLPHRWKAAQATPATAQGNSTP